MSTKENIAGIRAGCSHYPALLAFLTVLLIKQADWIWSSLYFQKHTVSEMSLALGFMALFFTACVELLRRVMSQSAIIKLIDFGIALLLVFIGFSSLRQSGLIHFQSTALQKTFAVACALTAGLLTLKIGLDTRKRLHLAGIVGGLMFAFFPVLLANTNATNIYWPSPSYQSPTLVPPNVTPQNTIVLLLDELSASAAGPVVEGLQAAGLHVTKTDMDPAGENTINVIPAIWSRTSFDQSVACGPTQLCSGAKVLDFAKVKASSNNIDIVGFYHRYCSIQDLRSCSFAQIGQKKSAGKELACSFPGVHMLGFLECDVSVQDRKSNIELRDTMQNALLEAPFWQKGGILFAHLLVPHPLMGRPLKTLREEYSDNIENGASVVKLVAKKAKLVFGDNFKIIVFSDHPLRSRIWCGDKAYMGFECSPGASQVSTQVPLIIAAPHNEKKAFFNIRNNQGVFDLLFE